MVTKTETKTELPAHPQEQKITLGWELITSFGQISCTGLALLRRAWGHTTERSREGPSSL